MPRALQATPSLLTYSARPPLGSIVEGAAIQPDEPVNRKLNECRVGNRSGDGSGLWTHGSLLVVCHSSYGPTFNGRLFADRIYSIPDATEIS